MVIFYEVIMVINNQKLKYTKRKTNTLVFIFTVET